MTVGVHNELPQENTIPTLLMLYTRGAQRCHRNARLKLEIMCIIGCMYNHPPPKALVPKLNV